MDHQAYFDDQRLHSVPEYWRRMGGRPDVTGRRVLEIGSGHGAMSLELASLGAHVVGLDLQADRVEWAKAHIEPREVAGSLRFAREDATALAEGDFDYVFSKDTFEHVADLGGMLRALRARLARGGEIWTGFSPLWYSPRGDHGEAGLPIPWGHLLSRDYVLRAASRRLGHPVRSLADVGLNAMSPADFRRYVREADLRFLSLVYNAGDKRGLRVLARLREVPGLERFATVGIYAKLTAA